MNRLATLTLLVFVGVTGLRAAEPPLWPRTYVDQVSAVDPLPPVDGVFTPPGVDDEASLLDRLETLETEVDELRAKQSAATDAKVPDGPADGADCTIDCDGIGTKHLEKLLAEYPKVRLTGFFQADVAWFSQSDDNRNALVNGNPLGDIQDGADFRRARLAAVGDAWENVGYTVEFDFAFPGRPSFMDVWLEVKQVPVLGNVRVGQFRQPFGMDALTSVRELLFFERALPFALVPFRQIGVGFYDHAEDERSTWAASVYRYPTDVFGSNVGDDGGYGFASRATWLPVDLCDGRLVHVGGNYAYANPSNNQLRFLSQPELFIGETPGALAPAGVPTNVPAFVDTGFIPSDHYNLFGVEAAAEYDSVYVQSEYHWMVVEPIAGPTLVFPGAYAQVGWFLTGETRPYNKASGVFGRVSPLHPFTTRGSDCDCNRECGWGAWELAARWSYLDLNDANITGNRLDDLTFGLNWFLNRNTKFQMQYVHAMLEAPNVPHSSADIVAMRGQVDF